MSVQFQQVVNTLSAVSDDGFVCKGYTTVLGRPADSTGLRNYVARLQSGVQRTQVWSELANSDEAKRFSARQGVKPSLTLTQTVVPSSLAELLVLNGAEFVRQAYLAVLGREADPSGLRDYVQRLEEGTSKSQLLADLRSDPEGKAFNAKLEGLDGWVRLVQQRASVADLFALQGGVFLTGAYVALFRREPDPDGFARYLALLKSGASRTFILVELVNSPEAREKSTQVRGLAKAIALYKKAQRKSWRGWYSRNVLGAESDLPADRERRALAYLCTTLATV